MISERLVWRSEVVDTEDRFFALQDEWKAFHKSFDDPHSSPFLCWDWLYLWWLIYRRPFWRLSIGIIRCDNRIVAIFPFYIKTLFIRRLYFIGTGELEREEVASEYLDCLIEKNNSEAYTRSLEWLHGFLPSVDMLVFQRMLESADLQGMLPKLDFPQSRTLMCGLRYKVDLLAGYDAVVAGFGSNLMRRYRKYRKLVADSPSPIRIEHCVSDKQLEEYFSDLKRLHELRWLSKGKPGAFSSARFMDFHRRYAQQLLADNRLYFLRIYIDGELSACLYTIDAQGVRYFYQAGFRPDMQQFAPGHLSHFVAIEDALVQGYSAYDFMLGSLNNSYKAQFISPGEKLVEYIAARQSWQMFIYRLAGKLQAWL